jgi:hypothetical protein
MNRIESVTQCEAGESVRLGFGDVVVAPISCTWAIALAGVFGGGAGYGFGIVNCHNHGCLHDSPVGVEDRADLPRVCVDDMVAMRAEAAALR